MDPTTTEGTVGVEQAGEAAPPVDIQPVEGTQPPVAAAIPGDTATEGAATTPPTEGAEAAPEPVQMPTFRLPGQRNTRDTGIDPAYQRQFEEQQRLLDQYRSRIEEFEFAGLEEEEAARLKLERQQEDLNRRVAAYEQQQAINEWRGYWKQFATKDEATELDAIGDPIQMGHHIVQNMYRDISTLQQENLRLKEQLKKATTVQQKGPAVTTGGQGAPKPKVPAYALDPAEREKIRRRIMQGENPF
jgi:hypothetical protein